ncbi:MAG: hypothetical protein KJZ47_12705, partial [Gemmatimonadales bacterium]|nr:hypothetical protein [Gemmatimonadales bacterium]
MADIIGGFSIHFWAGVAVLRSLRPTVSRWGFRPMKLIRLLRHATRHLALPALLLAAAPLAAQEAVPVARLVAEPGSLTMVAGTTAPLAIRALDTNGRTIANPELRVFGARR